VIGTIPAATIAPSAAAICSVVRSPLPGVTAMSPQSTTDWWAKTSTSSGGW
jgi:hypothetical protein